MLKKATAVLFALLLLTSCLPLNPTTNPSYNSFLFVEESSVFVACVGDNCRLGTQQSSGSGYIVATYPGRAIGVTAGHICSDEGTQVVAKDIKVSSLNGLMHNTEILYSNMDIDICVLKIYGYKGPYLNMSPTPPELGDKVYSIAAPMGIFTKGMAPVFDGYYSGRHAVYNVDAYTIPTQGGSSGAPIFNEDGELVGMTIARFIGFESLTLSPKYEDIKLVIDTFIEKENKIEKARFKKAIKEYIDYIRSIQIKTFL